LRHEGLAPADVGLLAVGVGPGSFTGIRTAIATARAIAWSTGAPMVGVSSLAALVAAFPATPSPRGALLAPVLDARKGDVYAALYRAAPPGAEPVEIVPDAVGSAGGLSREICAAACDEPVLLIGDGTALLRAGAPADARFFYAYGVPRPAMLAVLARARAAAGRTVSWPDVQPVYLRPSDAELNAPATAPRGRHRVARR
jgi:tRNA threonylcarbamoyladenosine biosynthesis protein TsaB